MKRKSMSYRAVGWLAVAGLVAAAVGGPIAATVSAAPLSGAIWTSLADGSSVNANLYPAKVDVYLNGGPKNCNGDGLPDGNYYFQVTIPSGGGLLSSDAIKFRQVQVVGGVIAGVSGAGNHDEGAGGACGSIPVQLFPYDDTTNNGGEYSVDIAPIAEVAACEGFDANTTFNFLDCNTSSKNDNFKVGEAVASTAPSDAPSQAPSDAPSQAPSDAPSQAPSHAPSQAPSEAPSHAPSDAPSQAPSDAPSGGVEGATATPGTTPPPTDSIAATRSSDDATRFLLLIIAGVIATLLVVVPSTVAPRRRK